MWILTNGDHTRHTRAMFCVTHDNYCYRVFRNCNQEKYIPDEEPNHGNPRPVGADKNIIHTRSEIV
jgi:hypothetical protein